MWMSILFKRSIKFWCYELYYFQGKSLFYPFLTQQHRILLVKLMDLHKRSKRDKFYNNNHIIT